MTATHVAFAPSRLVWLLPLGMAALSAACGTSPSGVGESAGGSSASAGNAGASSTSGGSDTASGGSTTARAGASGSNASGGASNAGNSSMAGSSNASAGGSGASCTTDADCGDGFNCLYEIADGCAAKAACFKAPGGPVCASFVAYCGCSGQLVDVPCYDPAGYAPAPVSSQQSSATCSATTPDAACVGKSCGESCSTGEVPAICDATGKCITGSVPACSATP